MASQYPGMTIATAMERRLELKVFCTNGDCERVKLDGTAPNGFVLVLKALGPGLSMDDLSARIVCQLCGKPGKLQSKAPPFNRGADSGFSTASSGLRKPSNAPSPPDRPDTPEMKWHGKHRPRRRRR